LREIRVFCRGLRCFSTQPRCRCLARSSPAPPASSGAIGRRPDRRLQADRARGKGYTGASDHIRTPYKGRIKPSSQKAANRAHAKLRGPGQRANAQLKTWRILRKLRYCLWKAGQLAKAIHVLQAHKMEG
jgi:DDE superfamily endonuclease